MSYTTYMMLLMFGVPAISAACLAMAICIRSGQISRREEAELDLLCYGAVEGSLKDFHPERQSSSH